MVSADVKGFYYQWTKSHGSLFLDCYGRVLQRPGWGILHHSEVVVFFASIVGTVFSTDLIKAKLADKLRLIITTRFIRIMNIVLGILLIVFAGRLILFPENIPH